MKFTERNRVYTPTLKGYMEGVPAWARHGLNLFARQEGWWFFSKDGKRAVRLTDVNWHCTQLPVPQPFPGLNHASLYDRSPSVHELHIEVERYFPHTFRRRLNKYLDQDCVVFLQKPR